VALNKHVPFHRINDGGIYVDRFYIGAEPETVGSVSRLRKQNVWSIIIFVLPKCTHVVLTTNYDKVHI
jgi:hypothetical protein